MKTGSETYKYRMVYDEIVVALTVILLVSFFVVLPLRSSSIRHVIVFAGSILFYIVSFLRMVRQKHHIVYFGSFALLIVIIILDTMFTVDKYTLGVFYAGLNFVAIFILLTTESTIVFSEKSLRWIYYGTLILSAITFLLAISPVAYVFEDGRNTGALVLGMTNPNVTGLILSGLINLLVIFFGERNRAQKAIIVLLIIGLIRLMLLTECRSALFSTAFVIIYAIFFRAKRLHNILVLIPLIFSVSFVPIYLTLYDLKIFNIVILGKDFFSGRQITYREYLDGLTTTSQWLFGNYGKIQLSNAHNAALCIMCSFGLVGLILVYANYLNRVICLNNRANSFYKRMAIVCYMSMFVQSSVEALMLTGIFPSIAIVYLYTVFCGEIYENVGEATKTYSK